MLGEVCEKKKVKAPRSIFGGWCCALLVADSFLLVYVVEQLILLTRPAGVGQVKTSARALLAL